MVKWLGLTRAPPMAAPPGRSFGGGAVVSSMSPGNVDTVLIGGQIKKRNGQLVGVDVDKVSKLVQESRDRTVAAAKYERVKL